MSASHANPYVGPRAFQDGETLYGRNQEKMQLLNLLISKRIILLYSPSGAGKTSLIQASLIPALRKEEFQVLPVIRVGLRPDREQELLSKNNRYVLSTLLSLEGNPDLPPEQKKSLLVELANRDLDSYLKQRFNEGNETDEQVLIFDQFEEILTLDPIDRAVKQEFFSQLGRVLRYRNFWALFAMREEFLGGLDPYLRLIPTRLRTTFRLELLKEKAAHQAIEEPARNTDIPFTDNAAVKLIDDLRQVWVQQAEGDREKRLGVYIEPVQLQVVCRQLWEKLSAEHAQQITKSNIEEFGNVDSALADYYAAQIRKISNKTKVSEWDIREWFEHHLITEQGLRGQVLMSPEQSQGLDNNAIELLEEAHLVRREKRLNSTWFELTHDRLIEPVQKSNTDWFQKSETIIADMAEDVYESMIEKQQEQMRHILTRLASVRDPDSYYTRKRRVIIKELVPEGSNLADTRGLLGELEVKRLLVIRKNTASDLEEVELSHEALIRYWSRLRDWLDTELESQRLLYRIRQAAWEWKRRNRDESFLVLQGSPLEEAEDLLSKDPTKFPDLEQAYVQACVALREKEKAEKEEQQQRELEAARKLAEEQQKLAQEAKARQAAEEKRARELRWLVREFVVIFLIAIWGGLILWEQTINAKGAAYEAEVLGSVAEKKRNEAMKAREKAEQKEKNAKNQLAKNYWLLGVNERDGNNNSLKASHYFMEAATLTDDLAFSRNARLAGDFLVRGIYLNAILKHKSTVEGAVFSHDKRRMLTWSVDKTAWVWETESGRRLSSLNQPNLIWGAVFSQDARHVLIWGADRTVRVWEAESGSLLSSLRHSEPVWKAVFSQDAHKVLTWAGNNTVQVWEVARETLISSLPHEQAISGATFSQDANRILTWSQDGSARLWKTEGGSLLLSFQAHEGGINGAVLSQDGRRMLTWGADGYIRVWRTESGQFLSSLVHPFDVSGAVFSQDGRRVLTWGADADTGRVWKTEEEESGILISTLSNNTVFSKAVFSQDASRVLTWSGDNIARLWEADSGTLILSLLHRDIVAGVAFSQDAARILTWSFDNTGRVWEIESETLISSFGDKTGINNAVFSQDSRRVLTWGPENIVRLWETKGDAPILSLSHDDKVAGAALSPDATRILTWSDEGMVRMWETERGTTPVSSFLAHKDGLKGVAFSQDARRVLTWGPDNIAQIWEVDSSTPIVSLPNITGVSGAVFSRDAERILTWSGVGMVQVWEKENHAAIASFQAHEYGINGAVFSQDAQRMLTWGADNTARVWETDSGTPIVSLPHNTVVSGAVFSRDAERILTWSDDGGMVRAWEDTGTLLASMVHNGVRGAKFSQDEHQVLTWGHDGSARIWATDNGQPLILPLEHREPVNDATFSQDERHVLTWSSDGIVRVWSLQVDYDFPQEDLLLKLEVQTGTRLNDKGGIVLLSQEEWQKKKEQYEQKVGQ